MKGEKKSTGLCVLPFQWIVFQFYVRERIFSSDSCWIRNNEYSINQIDICGFVYINHTDALNCMNASKYPNQWDFQQLNLFFFSLSLESQSKWIQTKNQEEKRKWCQLSTYSICELWICEAIFIYMNNKIVSSVRNVFGCNEALIFLCLWIIRLLFDFDFMLAYAIYL